MKMFRALENLSDQVIESRRLALGLDFGMFIILLFPPFLLVTRYTPQNTLALLIIVLTTFLVIRLLHRLITHRQKEKILLNSIADGLIAIDKNQHITVWNRSAEQLFGVTREKATGRSLSECIKLSREHEEGKKIDPIEAVLSGKQVSMVLDDQIATHTNGRTTPVGYSIAMIPDRSNKPAGAVIVIRDTTKEKEIDLAKTEFVSLASHQLRTPLSAINWYAEMLMNGDAGKMNTEQMDYLKEIYHGNQRMTELVNSLLNVSRLELGTLAIEPKATDIVEIIDSVLDEVKKQVEEKTLQIKKNVAAVGQVSVDPKLTRMIVQNLLTNAIKYTPNNGTITVELEKKKKNLELRIGDTGYGIPKHQQSKIFTKLFRADNVREKIADGTGLGLYIIKMILETGGGSISFKSVENKGTTFFVSIPLSGMSQKSGSKSVEL